MRWEQWGPLYERIAAEFGFSVDEDRAAAWELSRLAERLDVRGDEHLRRVVGRQACVLGHGPGLEAALEGLRPSGPVIAADGAASCFLEATGRAPDVIVTDLDGGADLEGMSRSGSTVVAHAHGDNVDRMRGIVPMLSGPVVLTCQCGPVPPVLCHGGFTDGDRAVELARCAGAEEIELVGFDFLTPRRKDGRDPAVKARKLAWARRIIYEFNPPRVRLTTL